MKDKTVNYWIVDSSLSCDFIQGIKLTPREIDTLAGVWGGGSAKKIASFLSLSPKTVENYIHTIMQKLECNSRERLIDFVEKSDRADAIKKHYANLLLMVEFEDHLKEIKKSKHQPVHCGLVIEEEQEGKQSFILSFEKHLKLAGLNLSILSSKDLELLSQKMDEETTIDSLICLASKPFIEKFHEEKIVQKLALRLKKILFLSLDGERSEENKNRNIIFIHERNYYLLVFETINSLLPQSNYEKIRNKFKEKEELIRQNVYAQVALGNQNSNRKSSFFHDSLDFLKQLPLKIKIFYGVSAVLIIGSLSVGFLSTRENLKGTKFPYPITQASSAIRSDLILPTEEFLLNRAEFIAKIGKTLKNSDDIQTVALIGTGGAGKTTLARLYARTQIAPLIWEINAETHENLTKSFEALAYALSQTEDDKKILREIEDIKDPEKKESNTLSFVKKKLKILPGWFLIYDNVEDFLDIQNYFPRDKGTWGNGKNILTTRNHNIQNNKHINSSIFVESLNDQQKLELFLKIMENGKTASLSPARLEEDKKFLKGIPPFPLDVSVAAYYLKATNISYKSYLEYLENPDQKFIDIQIEVLKDSSDYIKTRYGIIALSLQHLLSIDKNFMELLLLVSLLDSQNIPRDLLEKHKDKSLVDNFIYHLKKYSLINNSSESFGTSNTTFSIHRSTQAISLAYLLKEFNLTKDDSFLVEVSATLEAYIMDVIQKRNYREVEALIAHVKAFLNHKLLSDKIRAVCSRKLRHIYNYLGLYTKAQDVLEKSLNSLKQEEDKNYAEYFVTAVFLADNLRETGNYNKARDLLEHNLMLYKHRFAANDMIIPQALLSLGNIYRESGHYEKAKSLFENSLKIYANYYPNQSRKTAWVSIYLGDAYRHLGDYKNAQITLEKGLSSYKQLFPENHLYLIGPLVFLAAVYENLGDYKKAQTSLEKAYHIQQNNHSENHIYEGWVGANLANVYRRLGNHEKAQSLAERSLHLYQKCLPKNTVYSNWVLGIMGNIYKDSGQYSKAKDLLNKVAIDYEGFFGKNHIETARILTSLGQVYFLEENLDKAESLFKSAFEIFEQSKHPDIYICLESLSELYQKKSECARQEGILAQAQQFKDQSRQHLKQALEVITAHFPENSPHISRMKNKFLTKEAQ